MKKTLFRGEIVFFFHRRHKKTLYFLWIFISSSPISNYFLKKVFLEPSLHRPNLSNVQTLFRRVGWWEEGLPRLVARKVRAWLLRNSCKLSWKLWISRTNIHHNLHASSTEIATRRLSCARSGWEAGKFEVASSVIYCDEPNLRFVVSWLFIVLVLFS